MRQLLLVLLGLAALAASPARADEVIKTGPDAAPPVAEAPPAPSPADNAPADDPSAQAIGAWAQRVMSGAPAADEAAPARSSRGCTPAADRKPHGAVWGGIGTGGYRNVGGVVTQPIGACGQVTIAVDHTEGRGWRRR